MKSFNHTIALRVETCSPDPLDSKDGADLRPNDGRELGPTVQGEERWYSKSGDPGRAEHSELPPEGFLRKVEQAVLGFSRPPRHHVVPQPLPRALMDAEFVFVRNDASKPPLSPLYRGPYQVFRRSENFFVLQIGDKSDSVSDL